MLKTILKANHIFKSIKDNKILKDFNISLKHGEINALLGPNGAGKTTFLNVMLGLSEYEQGTVEIFGEKVVAPYDKTLKHHFGYIPDEPIVVDYLTGFENLQYMNHIYEKPLSDHDLVKILDEFNLKLHKDKLVKDYSKGMKQRLSLSYLFLYSPQILVLDEPTIGLDVLGVKELKEFLLLFKEQGCTILFTTHDIHFCHQVADVVTVINNGTDVKSGYMNKLLKNHNTVEEFLLNAVAE